MTGRFLLLIVVHCLAVSCASTQTAMGGMSARAFAAAERLFHQDPRWLGADAALSIPLSEDRTLWLFGDTFIATSNAHVRAESKMVRNTVAIQIGTDPLVASMSFYWSQDVDGSPASFFPESGQNWYWPGHGIRLDQERGRPLVVFLYKLAPAPGGVFGFKDAGSAIALIDNPDAPPQTWKPRIMDMAPNPFDAAPATAVIRDGKYIVAVAIRHHGVHASALVRYTADSLANGDTANAEWWAGSAKGWLNVSALGAEGPVYVLDDAGSECSIHFDVRTQSYIHIASYGFGATTIGLRTAAALTGPWSAPFTVYRPPESDRPRPFVYAAKAHPELSGPHSSDLLVTYATNSFDFGDLFTGEGASRLYWPRFVAISLGGY